MYSDSEIVAEVRQQAMPIEEPIEILDSELINEPEPEPPISSNEAFRMCQALKKYFNNRGSTNIMDSAEGEIEHALLNCCAKQSTLNF